MRGLRLTLAIGACALLGVGALALPATAANTNAAVVDLTNADRSARGLSPLLVAEDLNGVAQRKAEDMAAKRELKHSEDLGSQVSNWNSLGENIGRGPKVEDIHREFMASSTHSRNILEPNFTQIGAGVTRAGRIVYVAVIYRQPMTPNPAPPPAATPPKPPPVKKATAPPRRQPPAPKPSPPPPPPEPLPVAPPEEPLPQMIGPFVDEPSLLPAENRSLEQEALLDQVLAAARAEAATRSVVDSSLAPVRAVLASRITTPRRVATTPVGTPVHLAASMLALVTTGQAALLRRRLAERRRPRRQP